MSKGVTREMAVRAQEQLDKQSKLVERLRGKVDQMDRELREARIELHNEEEILSYYQAHPALRESNEMINGASTLFSEEDLSIQDRVEVSK
jgi:hypothetical protein